MKLKIISHLTYYFNKFHEIKSYRRMMITKNSYHPLTLSLHVCFDLNTNTKMALFRLGNAKNPKPLLK